LRQQQNLNALLWSCQHQVAINRRIKTRRGGGLCGGLRDGFRTVTVDIHRTLGTKKVGMLRSLV
jgi:hypothetical protein